MTRRSSGGNARNGMNRSHAARQVATAWGYFTPNGPAANSSSADWAADALMAV